MQRNTAAAAEHKSIAAARRSCNVVRSSGACRRIAASAHKRSGGRDNAARSCADDERSAIRR